MNLVALYHYISSDTGIWFHTLLVNEEGIPLEASQNQLMVEQFLSDFHESDLSSDTYID